MTMLVRSGSRASASLPSAEPLAWSAAAWLPSYGSRLRAVNTHEKNYTKGKLARRKLARRKAHVEESIARYLAELEQADSAETGPATPRIEHLTERLASLRGRLGELEAIGRQLEASPDG